MENTKELLHIFQEDDEKELLPYTKEWSAENLYCVLYYNLNDATLKHLARHYAEIDSWSHEEAIMHCADFISGTCTMLEISIEEFFEKYTVPEEVAGAFEEVRNYLL